MSLSLLLILVIALAAAGHEFPRWKVEWKTKKAAAERDKDFEKSETAARQQVLAEAPTLELPDAIFLIACHNRYRERSSWPIDPCEIFPNETPSVLAGWEKKAEQLLSMRRYVGFGAGPAGRGDIAGSEQELKEWNPGFSKETYAQAMRLSVRASRPDI
ncbi:MAG: hypothetical protein JO002_08295 [Burkholderiaceae bacterium]|nr:hypothetical protein [Burkholderiaceae bacterium]